MSKVFPIVPASGKAFWFLGGIAILLLLLICLLGYIGYSSRYSYFELSAEGLRIKGDLYRRTVPLTFIVVEEAKSINLDTYPEYQPKIRTNGTALPGYRSGWFKLRNGEKALMFVTDPNRVVYLPTKDNYSILISVANPEEFLQYLQEISSE